LLSIYKGSVFSVLIVYGDYMKWGKARSDVRGPSSSLGLLSFSESSKSLIRLSPEMVLVGAIVFGLVILGINFLF